MASGEGELPVPSEPFEGEPAPIAISPEEEARIRETAEFNALPLESFATVRRFEAAWELLGALHSYPLTDQRWAFRGHANADWNLESSIERLRNSYPENFRIEAEGYIRSAFKRRAHHYVQYLPGGGEELEWLALMRHHGAPTRLLDWTKSPYVAAFFALAEAKEDQVSAIWAIDIVALKRAAVRLMEGAGFIDGKADAGFSFSSPQVFERIFLQKTHPAIVAPVQPLKMNERAASQQGLFLCPNTLEWGFGFEFGLKQVLESDRDSHAEWYRENRPDEEPQKPESLLKLNIAPQARSDVLRELHRMNINYATLFPGLDGFARSLGTNISVSGFKFVWGGDDFDSPV